MFLYFIEQFYIESVVGMLAGQGGVVGDGSNSPTNYKEIAMLERGNITSMSKSLNEHMYLVVRR